MFHAITAICPRLVVWENVQGALSASAFSLMEPDQGHLGGRPTGPVLRALGRVLGDLAGIGYDATWTVVQASDVGAPHKRSRVFVVAHPHGEPWLERWEPATRETPGGRSWADVSGRDRTPRTLIPTPTASEGNLLPTPQATNATYSSNGYGPNLHEIAGTLRDSFGPYAPAVARWETITGRTAPAPTEPPLREGGKPRLSVRFVEWLMGLPDGHSRVWDSLERRHYAPSVMGLSPCKQQKGSCDASSRNAKSPSKRAGQNTRKSTTERNQP